MKLQKYNVQIRKHLLNDSYRTNQKRPSNFRLKKTNILNEIITHINVSNSNKLVSSRLYKIINAKKIKNKKNYLSQIQPSSKNFRLCFLI